MNINPALFTIPSVVIESCFPLARSHLAYDCRLEFRALGFSELGFFMLTDAFVSTTFMRNSFFVKIIKIPIPFFLLSL